MTVLALFSAAVLAAGQNAAQKYVEQLKTTDELREAVWGIRAVKVGGGGVAFPDAHDARLQRQGVHDRSCPQRTR